MILPNNILEVFYETLNGDRSVLEFEQWLYANRQLEDMMNPDDYMDLIAYGYKGGRVAQGLYNLLERHVRESEFKLWKQMRQRYPQGYTPTLIKTPFDEQLQRIKDKLTQARSADEDCMGFAAETHEYLLNVPATEEEVSAFEDRYSVQLPSSYRSFLLVVGNGGIGYGNSGAGPEYGIYPLGHGIDDLVSNDGGNYLRNDCLIDPDITMEKWKSLQERSKLFGGMLPLGSQGCSYIHAIVLNGPHKGCVVNLDFGCCIPPIFALEANFLDWYEKWLDKVIERKHQ
jgi:hypothetical protein